MGRERELQTLGSLLDEVRGGRGRLVLVGGEPGIGKTRLLEHLLAPLPQARVAWGRCSPMQGAPPYWPWSQVIRLLVERVPPDRFRAWLGPAGAELARLVPELGFLGPAPASLDGDEERFRLFDAVATLLHHVGADEPLAVVIEDLHWADSESLLLLSFVGAEAGSARLLVAATYRDGEMHQTAAAPHLLGELLRLGRHVRLGGLDGEATAALVAAAGLSLPEEALAGLQATTGGNPFFVKETCAHLRATPWSGGTEPLPIAPGVHEAVRQRLEPLDAEARRALEVGAVLGLEFGTRDLADAAGLAPAVVQAALAQALAAGLLLRDTTTVERWRFVHALVRDTVYGDLAAAERARLHGRVADVLEARHAGALDDVAGEIAAHLERALEPSRLARAVSYAVRAAEQSRAALGWEQAAACYERALEALRRVRGGARERLPLLLSFGEVQAWAGDVDGTRATFLEAARIARELGDAESLARAALGLGLVFSLLADDPVRIGLLREAAGVLDGDSPLRGRLLASLAFATYYVEPPERRAALSEEAIVLARRHGDQVGVAHGLFARYYALTSMLPPAERLAAGAEALAAAESAGLSNLVCDLRLRARTDHLELGDLASADRELAHAIAVAEASHLPLARWRAAAARAMGVALAGRLADAETLADEALALGRRGVHASDAAGFHAGQVFDIRRAQGRLAELVELLEAVAGTEGARPVWRAGLALAYVEARRIDDARRLLRELARADFTDVPRDWSRATLLALLADVTAALGDATIAARLEPVLAREASLVVVTSGAYYGAVARPLGRLALVLGRTDDAVDRLESAVALEGRLGARAAHARAQADLARALQGRRAPGDAARARELLASARSTALALGIADPGASGPGTPIVAETEPMRGPAEEEAVARLRRADGGWALTCGSEQVRLPATKGLDQLVALLQRPGVPIPAVELAERAPGAPGVAAVGDELRRRLVELRDDLADAEERHDLGRVEVLRDELERLVEGVTASTGDAGPEGERARLNVTRAVRSVLRRVSAACPRLGSHLEASVKTGALCCYDPDPGLRVRWEVGLDEDAP